jgi:hypothetical protein
MRIAIGGVALLRCAILFAARATSVAEPMPSAASASGLAVMLAILHLGATAAVTNGLKVPKATASNNRPPIEYGERDGCPYQSGPIMAADKPCWSYA